MKATKHLQKCCGNCSFQLPMDDGCHVMCPNMPAIPQHVAQGDDCSMFEWMECECETRTSEPGTQCKVCGGMVYEVRTYVPGEKIRWREMLADPENGPEFDTEIVSEGVVAEVIRAWSDDGVVYGYWVHRIDDGHLRNHSTTLYKVLQDWVEPEPPIMPTVEQCCGNCGLAEPTDRWHIACRYSCWEHSIRQGAACQSFIWKKCACDNQKGLMPGEYCPICGGVGGGE